MNSAIERLLSLRVSDIMRRDVIQVSAHESMGAAASRMLQHEISGAPVVDEYGHCVGILSAIDFVRHESDIQQANQSVEASVLFRSCYDAMTRPSVALGQEDDLVQTHMTPGVQAVAADTPLLDAARIMCGAHVHRLPIMDAAGHVEGIITTLDLVAAMVQAIDE